MLLDEDRVSGVGVAGVGVQAAQARGRAGDDERPRRDARADVADEQVGSARTWRSTSSRTGSVDADEALRLGLVSRVIDPAQFREEVLAAAEGIAATAPIASRLTKLALADGGHADFESGLQWEAMAQPLTLATEDLQEGIRAAREKRAPQFTGR